VLLGLVEIFEVSPVPGGGGGGWQGLLVEKQMMSVILKTCSVE